MTFDYKGLYSRHLDFYSPFIGYGKIIVELKGDPDPLLRANLWVYKDAHDGPRETPNLTLWRQQVIWLDPSSYAWSGYMLDPRNKTSMVGLHLV